MRKQPLLTEQYYHIYNRGVDKRDIFTSKEDIYRFIESIREFNQKENIVSLSNLRKSNSQIAVGRLSGNIKKESLINIVAYCLNPNHFHFLLKQSIDGGIAKFMQKLQGGYSCYFNIKEKRSGALFQGKFKSHLIDDDQYFNRLIGYVNNNDQMHEIPEDKKHLVFNSAFEYKNNDFKIVDKKEGERILEIFGGIKGFEKHCKEIINAVREERGKTSLQDDDNLLDGI